MTLRTRTVTRLALPPSIKILAFNIRKQDVVYQIVRLINGFGSYVTTEMRFDGIAPQTMPLSTPVNGNMDRHIHIKFSR